MHNHHHHFHDPHDKDSHGENCSAASEKALLIAFSINFIFAIIEFGGGIYTNSISITSDAIHDFGDSLAILFALFVTKLANKGSDQEYSYGYRRFTILGAIVNSIILLTGSTIILITAIPRIFSPEPLLSGGMMILAVLGVIFNYIAFKFIHKGDNLNDRTISLHLIEDIAGWVAVLIGSIIIYFTDFYLIDPVLSILIAIYIAFNVVKNLKQALSITMQSTPKDINLEEIRTNLQTIANVNKAHHMHVWSLDGQYNVMTVHILTSKDLDFVELEKIKVTVREELSKHNVQHCTIELEFNQ